MSSNGLWSCGAASFWPRNKCCGHRKSTPCGAGSPHICPAEALIKAGSVSAFIRVPAGVSWRGPGWTGPKIGRGSHDRDQPRSDRNAADPGSRNPSAEPPDRRHARPGVDRKSAGTAVSSAPFGLRIRWSSSPAGSAETALWAALSASPIEPRRPTTWHGEDRPQPGNLEALSPLTGSGRVRPGGGEYFHRLNLL